MGKRRRGKGKGVGGKRKKKQVHEDGEFNPDAQESNFNGYEDRIPTIPELERDTITALGLKLDPDDVMLEMFQLTGCRCMKCSMIVGSTEHMVLCEQSKDLICIHCFLGAANESEIPKKCLKYDCSKRVSAGVNLDGREFQLDLVIYQSAGENSGTPEIAI